MAEADTRFYTTGINFTSISFIVGSHNYTLNSTDFSFDSSVGMYGYNTMLPTDRSLANVTIYSGSTPIKTINNLAYDTSVYAYIIDTSVTPSFVCKAVPYKYEYDTPFVQPVLTENGTMGGSSFACSSSSYRSQYTPTWHAFDSSLTTYWNPGIADWDPYIAFYNPTAIAIHYLRITIEESCVLELFGSNDNATWNSLGRTSVSQQTFETTTITLKSNKPNETYKYYRLNLYYDTYPPEIYNISINGGTGFRKVQTATNYDVLEIPYVNTFVDTSTTLQVACSNPSATITNSYGTQKVGKPVGTEIEELECTNAGGISSWAANTLPSSADWESVTYGNGRFVAIAFDSNKAAYSYDGKTWTASTLPSYEDWQSVTYGGGKFVVVAQASNKAAYSYDGVTWTASTLPSSTSWYSVTYGNDRFVAVAYGPDSNKAAYSYDGTTWTASTLPSSNRWTSVTYGDGKFVAVAEMTDKAAYSTNGITWTASTMYSDYDWNSVTYGNGMFVAVAWNSRRAAYSTNGTSWTASTLPSSEDWQSVTYGDDKFVAVAMDTNKAAYSTNGKTWTSVTLPSSEDWYSVTYGNGKFVAVSTSSSNVGAYALTRAEYKDTTTQQTKELPTGVSIYNISVGDTVTNTYTTTGNYSYTYKAIRS